MARLERAFCFEDPVTTENAQQDVNDSAAEDAAAMAAFAQTLGGEAPSPDPKDQPAAQAAEPSPEEKAKREEEEKAQREADAKAAAERWLADIPAPVRETLDLVKSIDGRLRNVTGEVKAWAGTTNELKSAFQAANAARDAGGNAPSTAQIAAASADSKKWRQMQEDFPEWAEALEERLSAGVQVQQKAVDIDGIRNALREEVRSDVAMEIRAELVEDDFPGWKDAVKTPAFVDWIKAQPDDVKALAGSARVSDAKKLLGKFAESTKPAAQLPAPDAPAETPAKPNPKSRLEAAVTPTSGRSVTRVEPLSEEEAAAAAFKKVRGG